jgi:hypothetical protein
MREYQIVFQDKEGDTITVFEQASNILEAIAKVSFTFDINNIVSIVELGVE